MGAMRKAGVWLGLIEDDEDRGYADRGYDDEDFEDEVEEAPAPIRPRAAADRLAEAREAGRADRAERTPVRPLGRPGSQTMSAYPTRDNLALAPQVQLRERAVVNEEEERRYQITTLHPTTYNEARTIGEHFRDGVPVIMNLTEMAEADAKRLVDFAAGLAFGLRGTMERVTNRVFLLSPANVQVTEADKARIAEGGFFNQS
ncbi:MAG TPA: cell division protein SepF [Rugosimonospora sp.]|jgi:cell division inhibitor SepF